MSGMDIIKNKKILIDTNVLVYCGVKGFDVDAKKLLRLLKDNGNKLATSEINCFELIKNAIDEKLRSYYISLIDYIDKIAVTTSDLMNACFIYHSYHKSFGGNCKMGSMDLVVAGTAIYHKGCLLLTANRKDFPMPFWKLVAQCYIMRKKDEGNELLNIYLLEFDYSTIVSKKEDAK